MTAGTLTPDATSALYGDLQGQIFVNHCQEPSAEGARAYCDAQKAQASVATDIDACGWLDGLLSVEMDKIRCVKEWCLDKLAQDPNAVDAWVADDPLGRIDYLCGDTACGDDRSREQCVFEFQLAAELGDVAGSCEFMGCNSRLANCL